MGNFDEDAVFERLTPWHGMMSEAFHAAWKTWSRDVLPHFPAPPIRFRRNAMHALIVKEIRSRFQDTPGVSILETKDDRFLLHVSGRGGDLIVQFKHLDDGHHTRNYPTATAKAFDRQIRLPELPDALRVTAGYQLNQAETDIVGVFVVRARGQQVDWWYELARPGSDRVTQLPAQRSLSGIASPTPSRVRAKAPDAATSKKRATLGLRVVKGRKSGPDKKKDK